MPTEFELRFRVTSRVARNLLGATEIEGWRLEAPASGVLKSTYFDRPDHVLGKLGVGVRLREEPAGNTLTVKLGSDADASLGARKEFTRRTDAKVPDPRWIRRHLPKAATDGPLGPVFRTEVTRTVRTLRGPNRARVELALDQGTIRAGRRRARVLEAEIELKAGRPRALYDLALALHKTQGPFTLEPRTKSARGYALAEGKSAPCRGADDIAIAITSSGEAATKAILRSCLAQIVANQAAAVAGEDMEGVHQMRVGVRRLRTALACLARMLPADARKANNAEFRWLGRELADAREWDVLIAETLAPATADGPWGGVAAQALERARAKRDAGYERVRRAVRGPRYTAAMLVTLGWLEAPWAEAAGRGRARRLSRPFVRTAWKIMRDADRRLRQDRAAVEDSDPARLHAVRIAAKNARYVTEFMAALAPPAAVVNYVKALKRVQDAFGYANDATRAQVLLGSLLEGSLEEARRVEAVNALVHPEGPAKVRHRMTTAWRAFEAAMPVHEAMGHNP